MYLGVPCVVSYAGGLPNLAQANESALFFPPGDAVACADQVEALLHDRDRALSIGAGAREVGRLRNDPDRLVKKQMSVYLQIVKGTN